MARITHQLDGPRSAEGARERASSGGGWKLVRAIALLCLGMLAVRVTLSRDVSHTSLPRLETKTVALTRNVANVDTIRLGERLFFEKLLSSDRSINCATCHKPELAFGDDLPLSRGFAGRTGTRNAPAIINRAYGTTFFWDGRVSSLEEQVVRPIEDPSEMNLPVDELVRRLKKDPSYSEEFKKLFRDGITLKNIGCALASFVRTIRSGEAPFDEFSKGRDEALSHDARRGLELFFGKANCVSCHAGANFTDEEFHNTGVAFGSGDRGRYDVTREEKHRGAFKTPTLREIGKTAPYMHDGSMADLKKVVEFYNRGGNSNPYIDPKLRPLHLTIDEEWALVAFLQSLGGKISAGAQ